MIISKCIVARHSPDNGCYADDDEILDVGRISRWPLKPKNHYFVGRTSGKKSKFGWIVVTHDTPYVINETPLFQSEIFTALDNALTKLNAGDAVAVDFVARGIPPENKLLVHKVLFYKR